MEVLKKIILGTVQFGLNYGINNRIGKPTEETVFNILDLAYQKGISILDTADAYGDSINVIGSYHLSHTNRFLVNTKFSKNETPIYEQLIKAITMLGIENVNTYFYHKFSDFVQYSEIGDELLDLKRKKLINKIGLSVYGNDQLEKALDSEWIDVIQAPFNILDNNNQKGKLLEKAKKRNKEIQARSIFLQGLFFMPLSDLPIKLRPLQPYLEKIRDIAYKNKIEIEELALKYVINQTCIDNVIIGIDSSSQLERNTDCFLKNQELPVSVLEELNNLRLELTDLLNPVNWN
jgi:aryl-alcohol dehydrogenase-like predicted oxidoreductase